MTISSLLTTLLLLCPLSLRAQSAAPPFSAETCSAVRASAAEMLSRYAKPADGNHLSQLSGSIASMRIESEGLRIADVIPLALEPSDREGGIDARFAVTIGSERYRTTNPKIRRWSNWKTGRATAIPPVIIVERRGATWLADERALTGLKRFSPGGKASVIPQDTTPALPPGTALPTPAPPPESKPPGWIQRNPVAYGLALAFIALTAVVATVSIRRKRGTALHVSEKPTPNPVSQVANPAPAMIACRPREHLLSPAEHQFLQALAPLVRGTCGIFHHPRLADLFEVLPGPSASASAAFLNRTIVSFALADAATSRLLGVIELEDPSRRTDAPDPYVAAFLHHHRIPVLRLTIRNGYDASELRRSLASSGLTAPE